MENICGGQRNIIIFNRLHRLARTLYEEECLWISLGFSHEMVTIYHVVIELDPLYFVIPNIPKEYLAGLVKTSISNHHD